ncbi:C80 family cysteine peptidase [Providencia vermicola]|uniref:C80 family cysteine peptidase n=1 Tax=Providencia vermicola TaxID=333965 RepID=UPI0032DBDE69
MKNRDVNFNKPDTNVLAGEQSERTSNIESWANPMDVLNQLKAKNIGIIQGENDSQYEYNVIIQVGADDAVAESIAKLIPKYNNKVIVIQFDLMSWQWKVLHGDITNKPEGKIRWIAVGHGKFRGENQESLFEGSNAEFFARSLKYIKNNILKEHQPDKIVLAGCQLGRGGPNENFVFRSGVELAKHGMYLPIVGYNREISITKESKKKIYIPGFFIGVDSTKAHRLEIQVNSDTQHVVINNKSASLYFIDELRERELDLWQLIKDDSSKTFDIFRNNDNTIDVELIKTMAYNDKAYEIFKSKIGGSLHNFRSEIVAEFNSLGILEAPLWSMIDINKNVNENTIQPEVSTVIFRSGNGDGGKMYAEKIASLDPNNTVVFQINPNTMQFFIEHGDVEKLTTQKNQQWIVIDNIRAESGFMQNLTNIINVLKHRYQFTSPENISFYFTDKKSYLDVGDKFEFTKQFSIKLKEKGINSNINLEMHTEKNHKLMFLLKNIALNNIKKEDVNIKRYTYLKDYFSLEDGSIDYNKMNISIYDPIVSKKITQYFNDTTECDDFQRWNSVFEDDKNVSIKQQAIELKEVLKFLSLQPEKINCLSKASINRLSGLFPTDNGVNYANVLNVVSNPEVLENYNKKIDHFLMSYIEIKTPFDNEKLFNEEFKYILDMEVKQNIIFNNLLDISKGNNLKATARKVEPAIFYDDGINFLYIASHYGISEEQEGKINNHLSVLKEIIRKDALDEVTWDEKFSLNEYKKLYEKQGMNLASATKNIKSQTHSATINNIENDQVIYFQSDSEAYMILSYMHDNQYYISLSDSSGVEITVNHNDLVVAKEQFLNIFTRFINQEIEQDNGQKVTQGAWAGFNHIIGEDLYGEVSIINTKSSQFQKVRDTMISELDSIFKSIEISVFDDIEAIFGEQRTTLKKLRDVGANINGEPLNTKHIQQQNWQDNLNFDEQKLSSKLAMVTNNSESIELILMLKNSFSESDYKDYISNTTTIQNQALLKDQLSIIYNAKTNESAVSKETIHKLQKTGMKLPIYNRAVNAIGQSIGGIGIFQTINSVYQLIDELNDSNLTEQERAELQRALDLACANAFFNYGDMVLQPILLKIAYKQAGSFNASGKITARITLIFSLIGMGLDVYQACEAFKQLDNMVNSKERQDLIVNGSLSIANIVVGGITVLGILIGSSTLPVIGLIVAGALLIGGMVYTGIRAVEKIEEELGESLKWDEKAKEGIRAALGFKPSDDILNRFSHKQHIEFYKNIDWQYNLEFFKNRLLHQEFEEHLQLISTPILDINDKYYIKYWMGKNVIQAHVFVGDSSGSILSHIDIDEVGPCYTLEQINYIRDNFSYDSKNHRWVKSTLSMDLNYLNFNRQFNLIDKEAPFSYKEIGKIETDDILILNKNYRSEFFDLFLLNEKMQSQYAIYRNNSLLEQLSILSKGDLRFFRSRNKYTNVYHPDFSPNEKIGNTGHEYIRSPNLIFNILRRENKEIVYEGMHNIGYTFEPEARSKNISLNLGAGKDVIIGKENAKNAFVFSSGIKFFAGGNKDDVVKISLTEEQSGLIEQKIYFDGGGGENRLIINGIPGNSRVQVDLKNNSGEILINGNLINQLHLRNTRNITLNGLVDSVFELYGDDEDNILDTNGGVNFINGGAGNDRIYFDSGIVTGDEGTDIYFLRKHNDLINEKTPANSLAATIIENDKENSVVYLGYSLKNIKNVAVVNNDIVITFKMDSEIEEKTNFLNLTLKNVYTGEVGSRMLNHHYQLVTNDGFILTSQFDDKGYNSATIFTNKIYTVNYQEKFDSLNKPNLRDVYVNTNANIIAIDNESYSLGTWAVVGFIENNEGFIYCGSDESEKIILSNLNNNVMVSKGDDTYLVVTDEFRKGKLVFDFLDVQSNYSEHDSMTIKLTSINGFNLKIENGTIYEENIFGDKKFEIGFINYNELIFDKVKILDKNNKIFRLEYNEGNIKLINYELLTPTDDFDYINIQPYHNVSEKIIDLRSGNDVIFDESMSGSIINGGEGNDKIVTVSGENILYGGHGDDILYGGNKSDLLLSDLGNDRLDGMMGDDYYIVDGNKGNGETVIDDVLGVSRIYLINFYQEFESKTINDNLYYIYTSKSNGRKVKIKVPSQVAIGSISVYHYEQLPNSMPSSVNENMSHLVRYLAEQKNYAKQVNPLIPYHPFDEFMSKFHHNLPEKISLNEAEIRITSQSNSRHRIIHTKGREQKVWDSSGHGRVFKVEAEKGLVSIPNGNLSNNVLYAKQSETNLFGGDGDDVLISNGANGLLADEKGENVFIINGDLSGWNSIYSLGGENTIYLVNFKQNVIREEPDHISNATRYIYESENGRTVKIFQYPNTQAPTIVHQQWDNDSRSDNVLQKLEYLVNTLASIRMQDETLSTTSGDLNNTLATWEPVKLVKNHLM